jgi:cell division protein FtsW
VFLGLGLEINGANRWLRFPIQWQPSEVAKIGLIIFYASYLARNRDQLKTFKTGIVVPIFLLAIPLAILFLVQNHGSVCIIIAGIIVTMMFVAGSRLRYFVVGVAIVAVCAGSWLYISSKSETKDDFRFNRIMNFLDPWQDPKGEGWQVIQGLYAIGSGGVFGVGLGDSKQKYLYIPEPHNDFIFAVIAEELGFIGCMLVVLLFLIFIWRGIVISVKTKDMFGSLIAIGITAFVRNSSNFEYCRCYI